VDCLAAAEGYSPLNQKLKNDCKHCITHRNTSFVCRPVQQAARATHFRSSVTRIRGHHGKCGPLVFEASQHASPLVADMGFYRRRVAGIGFSQLAQGILDVSPGAVGPASRLRRRYADAPAAALFSGLVVAE
jgi:hypothetical protein